MKRALALLLASALAEGREAHASVDVGTACVVRGKSTIGPIVYAGPTGDVQLLSLAYLERSVELSELPPDTIAGRMHLRAHRDVPGLRADGWVSGKDAPLFAAREIPIVASVVALNPGVTLRVLTEKSSVMRAEPRYPTFARTRAVISCDDLTIDKKVKASPSPPSTKSWIIKNKVAALYATPTGAAVFQLEPLPYDYAIELAGYETVSGFQHVRWNADVHVDGWIKSSDLRAPAPDESGGLGGLMGGMSGSSGSPSVPKYALASVDTDVFLAPSPGLRAAILEKGAKVRVWKMVDGWAEMAIPDAWAPFGKAFHVRIADLTLLP